MIPLHHVEQCASTNDEILKFLYENDELCSLFTFNQTKGRGQYGNRWESQAGNSLAYSTALNTSAVKKSQTLFNYHTACTVRDFLAKLTASPVEIKWPNDLIIGGKKVAGILIEKVTVGGEGFYIIGTGINLRQSNFEGLPDAGSIFSQTGQIVDNEHFVHKYHDYLIAHLTQNSDDSEILERFNRFLFRKGKISVFEKQRVRQNGIIRNADADGFLWIELEQDGLQRFYHKEIQMLY